MQTEGSEEKDEEKGCVVMEDYEVFELWSKLQEKAKALVSAKIYEVWIKPITPLSLHENTYTVVVRNQFFKRMLEEKYLAQLEDLLQECSGRPLQLAVECEEG